MTSRVRSRSASSSALDAATAGGLSPFVTLSTLDTGGLTMPADLQQTDGLATADGLPLDGPEITSRFRGLLSWLVPELLRYGVWGLAIANEPSTLFESIDRREITDFLIDGAEHVRALDTPIAVTVTLAGGADDDPEQVAFIADLMPSLDIASFNFYCLDSDSSLVTDPADWASALDRFRTRADGREVVFQEVGCPAGWSDLSAAESVRQSVIGASPATQDEFFRTVFDRIERQAEIRAAYVFQLNDWSPALATTFSDAIREEGNDSVAERLEEWLATIGLCRWAGGECRVAYDTFRDAVARFESLRDASGSVDVPFRPTGRER